MDRTCSGCLCHALEEGGEFLPIAYKVTETSGRISHTPNQMSECKCLQNMASTFYVLFTGIHGSESSSY